MAFENAVQYCEPLSGADDIVLAIQRVHSDRIFSGEKKYELRRVVPKLPPGRIFLYETNGERRISGHLVISRVLFGSPDAVWSVTSTAGTTKARFFEYFSGADFAYAYEIKFAIQYDKPIDMSEIQKIEPSFHTPQSFVYLENYPRLKALLRKTCLKASFTIRNSSGVKLSNFDSKRTASFTKLVDKHITGYYEETGPQYAAKLIELNDADEDPEGIFTLTKLIRVIDVKGELAGFTVLTEKIGGAIKTGPTVLITKYQKKGIGKQVRRLLHEGTARAGLRKIYCTVPIKKDDAFQYLVSSGYRIEAHLRRHYHADHDEIVMGYRIASGASLPPDFSRTYLPAGEFSRVSAPSPQVTEYISQAFERTFTKMPLVS